MRFCFHNIPRGVIYHRAIDSIKYFFMSFFSPLNDQDVIKKFEDRFAEYCGQTYCVAFPFARTSIFFVLKHLNLPKGSEIILPPITIKGIVDVVLELGLIPVYVDLDVETLNFDLAELDKKITPHTKVAIITPLFGLVPDMKTLIDRFHADNIFVIEDFSQCLNGAFRGTRIGTFGDVGVYSSSSIKTLDTLGGGLTITQNKQLYERLKEFQSELSPPNRLFLIKKAWINLIRNIATTRLIFSILVFPFLQLLRKFDPHLTLKQTGSRNKNRLSALPRMWFAKYSSFQAAIGLAHIECVRPGDDIRIWNAEYVKSNCTLAGFPKTTNESRNIYWQLLVIVKSALVAQDRLAAYGIDSATSSLELVSALVDYPNQADTPVAQNIYQNGIFLPCFPGLGEDDLARIVKAANLVDL